MSRSLEEKLKQKKEENNREEYCSELVEKSKPKKKKRKKKKKKKKIEYDFCHSNIINNNSMTVQIIEGAQVFK